MNPSVDGLGRARIALARLQEAALGSMGVDDMKNPIADDDLRRPRAQPRQQLARFQR